MDAIQFSESIGTLSAALVEAQTEFPVISATHRNPFAESWYADLKDIIVAVRNPLKKQGLCFMQHIIRDQKENRISLATILLHKSGEYIISTAEVPVIPHKKMNLAQQMSSGITYLKRYALVAILGIAVESDDDDGNRAGNGNSTSQKPPKPTEQEQGCLDTICALLVSKLRGKAALVNGLGLAEYIYGLRKYYPSDLEAVEKTVDFLAGKRYDELCGLGIFSPMTKPKVEPEETKRPPISVLARDVIGQALFEFETAHKDEIPEGFAVDGHLFEDAVYKANKNHWPQNKEGAPKIAAVINLADVLAEIQ